MGDMPINSNVALNNGVQMPRIGLGTWRLSGDEGEAAVVTAIESGYRSIDTAAQYANEEMVGRAIRRSGIARGEIFVTTKLGNAEHAYDDALKAFDASSEKLGLEQVDLYLIHWPAPQQNRYLEAWRALERLYAEGRVRAIGVSNFTVGTLNRLLGEAVIVPAINQIELHPALSQAELRAFHSEYRIETEAWKPLGQGRQLLNEPLIAGLARRYSRTPAQVVLRWHLQLGNIAIPKSARASRMSENLGVFDFEIEDTEMTALQTLDSGRRLGEDPEMVN